MYRSTLLTAGAIALSVSAMANTPIEVPISAPGPESPLSGTLRKADGKQIAVALIIPGSGPTDRDGNNPLVGNSETYRLLAAGLAKQGISSVRIDKRGMFGSRSAVPDPNAVTIPDYVNDTASWIAAIRAQTGAPCVWVIGHSEGGLVALASASQVEDICGLVLLATGGRPFGEVISGQLRGNPANAALVEPAVRAINELTAGRRVAHEALPGPLIQLFHPSVQGYLISAMSLDPAELIAETTLPLLIVQGGKDLQVPVADGERLKMANSGAKLIILPNANHVLKDVAGDSPSDNLAAYRDPDLPLSEGLVSGISTFVRD